MANDFYGNMLAANIPQLIPSGSVFYVDGANGLDTYDGKTPARAFKTLTAGYAALTENKNDMLVYIGNQTYPAKLTATLDWGKDYTHLIGACSPVGISPRARIFGHADNTLTPLIKISANGCSFRNILVNYGVAHAESLVAVEVTGSRNYFENCHFAGIGNAEQDAAGACSLKLNGCTENLFKHCSIGLDTVARGADNSEILADGRASKQMFEDCFIYANASAGGHSLLKTNDIEGLAGIWMFKNCVFMATGNDMSDVIDSAFNIHAGGPVSRILLDRCSAFNITAWDANTRGRTYIVADTTDAATDGIAVKF